MFLVHQTETLQFFVFVLYVWECASFSNERLSRTRWRNMIAGKAVLKTLRVSLTLSDNCPKLSIYFRTGLVTVRVFRYGTHSCVQLITTSCATLQQATAEGGGSVRVNLVSEQEERSEKERERERERRRKAHICWHQNCGTLNSSFFQSLWCFTTTSPSPTSGPVVLRNISHRSFCFVCQFTDV